MSAQPSGCRSHTGPLKCLHATWNDTALNASVGSAPRYWAPTMASSPPRAWCWVLQWLMQLTATYWSPGRFKNDVDIDRSPCELAVNRFPGPAARFQGLVHLISWHECSAFSPAYSTALQEKSDEPGDGAGKRTPDRTWHRPAPLATEKMLLAVNLLVSDVARPHL